MTLGSTLSDIWHRFQGELFPALAEEVGPLLEVHKRFVTALDLVRVERFVGEVWNGPGRPQEDRRALARGFIAKAVWDLPTTRHLIDRLKVDPTLRRLCGWSRVVEIPSEATFSRAFAEFSQFRIPERMHEALVEEAMGDELIGHVSRDSTAIEAREKPAPKPEADKTPKRKRGRPRKGEEKTKKPSRLEQQVNGMSVDEMLAELPKLCNHGGQEERQGVPDVLARLQVAGFIKQLLCSVVTGRFRRAGALARRLAVSGSEGWMMNRSLAHSSAAFCRTRVPIGARCLNMAVCVMAAMGVHWTW